MHKGISSPERNELGRKVIMIRKIIEFVFVVALFIIVLAGILFIIYPAMVAMG